MNAGDAYARLRVQPGEEPELRCPQCNEWWPITVEFWTLNRWWRCLTCKREGDRLRAALRRKDPEYQRKQAEYIARYRAYLRKTSPDLVPAWDREMQARRREYDRQYRARKAQESAA